MTSSQLRCICRFVRRKLALIFVVLLFLTFDSVWQIGMIPNFEYSLTQHVQKKVKLNVTLHKQHDDSRYEFKSNITLHKQFDNSVDTFKSDITLHKLRDDSQNKLNITSHEQPGNSQHKLHLINQRGDSHDNFKMNVDLHNEDGDRQRTIKLNLTSRKRRVDSQENSYKAEREFLNNPKCKQWFEKTLDGNLDVIAAYPRGDVAKYMSKIGGDLKQPKTMMTSFPVLVTAANSHHYNVLQGLLKSIHEMIFPKYGKVKVIVYDLGLGNEQALQLKKYCKCDVRKFPFEEYPDHVGMLKTYTWKPIIVKTVLMEFGWVWWLDGSARFTTSDLDKPLQYSINNSILFFTYGAVLSAAKYVDNRTMRYLREDSCKFRYYGQIEAGFVLYHFDHVTNVLVDQWAACAVSDGCMAPKGATLSCSPHTERDGSCHRFDQSVLSILLRRLFHEINDYPDVTTPFQIHVIRRGEAIAFFPD